MGVPGPSASDLRAGTYQGGPNSSILDGHMLTILDPYQGSRTGRGASVPRPRLPAEALTGFQLGPPSLRLSRSGTAKRDMMI